MSEREDTVRRSDLRPGDKVRFNGEWRYVDELPRGVCTLPDCICNQTEFPRDSVRFVESQGIPAGRMSARLDHGTRTNQEDETP